ncbi:uncharacterized protein MEPE_00294 [Melanopsichium pennsylvanicum]|uniref:Polysaccharide lyase 14 domain-containing protein n=2 Tax=Melanopsichium pennsylvanicum TaxID=63383 RepID=A0AAJ4XFT2_9BASI|nr:conserved hypothetical protein [Melanopsichium pennsylvanicum 4]SNX81589.1 uncharacterized protein MEPE_00294 [Melanopsichium pennsylvanicum]
MHYHSVKHDDRTSSSSLTELGESNTMLPHTTRFSTKRVCARRRILLTVPLVALVVFAAIFFPVYLTHSNNNKSSSSSSQQSSATTSSAQSSAAAAAARTTPGAEWVQTVDFENLDDLRIDYYSSGQNNSNILTSGLPEDVWSSRSPSSERRRRRSDEADVTMVEVDAIVFKRTNKPLRREEVSSSSSSPTRTSTISTSTFTGQSTSTSLSYSETTTSTSTATPTSTQIPVEQGGSVLQIFYPKGSYTPSQLPVGGTQFYAETPFDLTLAQSVTFNYSVFFPAYYNFVLGGKLPGLYGGQEGCGGGNNAQDCWSSRMAWRANGTGELYAYLPQDKQNLTAMLQVPPYSYVNTNYGM